MLNYVRQFLIRVVFLTLYLWNEVSEPHLTQVTRYLTAEKVLKIYRLENFRANVLNFFLLWHGNESCNLIGS